MKTKNKFDRYRYYLNKKIDVTVDGFRFGALQGRIFGPKVLLNSIPKSGTNLITALMKNFSLMRHFGKRTIMEKRFDSQKAVANNINKIKAGQYAVAHIKYSKKIEKVLQEKAIRSILMIRDPRAVLYSILKYVTDIDKSHAQHKLFNKVNGNEGVKLLLRGSGNIVEPLPLIFENYLKWEMSKDVLVVNFEDLIGTQGGGNREKQVEVVNEIINHLMLSDMGQAEDISKNIYSEKSPTFNKGSINSWKEKINDQQKDLIKEYMGDLLIRMGYEQNYDW